MIGSFGRFSISRVIEYGTLKNHVTLSGLILGDMKMAMKKCILKGFLFVLIVENRLGKESAE